MGDVVTKEIDFEVEMNGRMVEEDEPDVFLSDAEMEEEMESGLRDEWLIKESGEGSYLDIEVTVNSENSQ